MVESSTFSSELVAMCVAKELIVALCYKLQMLGVLIDSFTCVFCDNQGVVKNTSIPESTLHKKHIVINSHSIQEAAAMDIICIAKEDSKSNLADFLTKVLPYDQC